MSHSTTSRQARDRNYAQLANNLNRLSRAIGQTADLFEQLQVDLDAMRVLSGWHAADFITIATSLELGDEETSDISQESA